MERERQGEKCVGEEWLGEGREDGREGVSEEIRKGEWEGGMVRVEIITVTGKIE